MQMYSRRTVGDPDRADRTEWDSAYEVSLFIGSFNNETEESFTKDELITQIAKFQDASDLPPGQGVLRLTGDNRPNPPPSKHPVRVTETAFVYGHDYRELGWQVTAIQYPRAWAEKDVIFRWMSSLAEYLLDEFKQHRICVQDSRKVVMFGA